MKKYKYTVFCPYFGKLPNNFELWLKSCSYNNDFKFIVFTNDTKNISIPKNVEMIKISFENFKKMIQNKFDFKISLDNPYKLCDYKIAYGYLFSEYVKGSKYWGACDMDLIFGNIKKFIPDGDYDKISTKGHLTLFKNNKDINEAFMITNTSNVTYRDILSSNIHFASDEIGDYSINNILKKNGYKIYNFEDYVADISTKRINMRIAPIKNDKIYGKRVFAFENGKIICYELLKDKIKQKEYAYIHFQKRKMTYNITNNDFEKFIITYKSFENYNNIDKQLIKKYQPFFNIDNKIIKMKYNAFIKKIKRKKTIRIIGGKTK